METTVLMVRSGLRRIAAGAIAAGVMLVGVLTHHL